MKPLPAPSSQLLARCSLTAMNPPITPGEILLEEYLKPMGISQNAMARAVRVPPRAINEFVPCRRAITPAMSIRFGAFFGQSDNFWYGCKANATSERWPRKKRSLPKASDPPASLSVHEVKLSDLIPSHPAQSRLPRRCPSMSLTPVAPFRGQSSAFPTSSFFLLPSYFPLAPFHPS